MVGCVTRILLFCGLLHNYKSVLGFFHSQGCTLQYKITLTNKRSGLIIMTLSRLLEGTLHFAICFRNVLHKMQECICFSTSDVCLFLGV